jgi:predicted aconitase with swiveling domain
VPGRAEGEVLVLAEPLSLWGGVEVSTGRIVEASHPQCGEHLGGKIVVMPHGRGSSSSSSVLAELLRSGTGPVGIVLEQPDAIMVVGSLVARSLYGIICPLLVTHFLGNTGETWQIEDALLRRVSHNRG